MTDHKQHMDRFHRELEEYLDQQNVGEGEDLQKYLDQFMVCVKLTVGSNIVLPVG